MVVLLRNVQKIIMKKEGVNSGELSNFHLQLFSLEEQENNIKVKAPQATSSFLYRIKPLPISISLTAAIAYFALFLLWFILLLDSYQLAYTIANNNTSIPILHSVTSSLFGVPVIGYIVNGVVLGVIVVGLVFRGEEGAQGLVFFLWYLGSHMEQSVRYLVEAVLFFSAFFAYTLPGDILSIFIFILAALLACFYTIFLQNITLRKDQFCCKSLEYSCLFRIALIVSLAVCIIMGAQVTTKGQLAGCVVGHFLISSIMLGCYFSFGMTTYRQTVGRMCLISIVTLYFCLSIGFIFDLLATSYYVYTSSNHPLICGAVVFVGEFFFMCVLDRMRRISNHPSCNDLRRKVFFTFNKFELADQDEEVDCQIRGIMHEHYMQGCRNAECIVNLKECYDSKKKKKCSITKIAQGKVSVVKFYVKCLYETALTIHSDDIHLELDYIQFFYLKLKNVFTVLTRIARLQHRYLTFYQRLRLTRIKEYLTQQSNDFSRDLYNRSLSMEQVIRSEETFVRIQQLIEVLLSRNELFWRYLSFSEVHLRQILNIVKPNFTLLQDISTEWTSISNYFPINRRWKFYHLCFTAFVKNEKVKPAMLEDFGNSVQYDSIFKTDNYFVDKTTEKEHLYNPLMLFQQNTCFLHARCDEEKMVITRVSSFFQRNFDYDPQEIVGCSLNQLMPPSIQAFHHSMFLTWAKDGKSSNEACYEVKKIYPITKRGYLYPCFKFYKRYIQLGGDVEFVAMLKSNRQDEQLMLINSAFQIEGITISLHHKLKLRTGDYLYLKGINVLALMPMLAKYTHLSSFIQEHDQDFLENDDNQGYYKRQGTLLKNQAERPNILHDRRLLNLTNIKFFMPNNLQATLEQYKHLLHVRKLQSFDAVRELYSWIRKEKDFLKFKAEVCIRERQTFGQLYYEIEVNQMEENNRLERLRKAEEESESEGGSSQDLTQNRLTDIDMQLFFSMSKKKNKVTLFPSKNIFLKDDNNRALLEIPHITNINLFFRFALLIFLTLVLTELLIELAMVDNFVTLTNQFYQVSRHQKVGWMLNTQYKIQHLQPGNSWEESFFIIAYTHTLLANYASPYFQALLFDPLLNRPGSYPPYYPLLPTNLTDKPQPTFDQYAIFFQYFQSAISLHRQAELYPQSRLQNINYYQYNNYIFSIYNKIDEIKTAIKQEYRDNYLYLRRMGVIFGVVIMFIVLGCLLFSLSRLWKVSNGFKELVSILIQIDNSDMRDICKYVDYTHYLFQHLKDKNTRMSLQSDTHHSSASSNFRSFQKRSSEMTEEEMRIAASSANLNKRIKKIDMGDEITKMMMKSGLILLATIILVGGIAVILSIYATVSLDSVADFQQLGFTFMGNNGVNNILASAVIEKYTGSVLYDFTKYQSFLNKSLQIQISNENLHLTIGPSSFQQNMHVLYYDNFCELMKDTFNSSMEEIFGEICDITNAVWCSQLQLSEDKLVERCMSLQSGQMAKGVENYNNFFLSQAVPFFKDSSNLTLLNIVEINDAYKIIDIMMLALMSQWKDDASAGVVSRKNKIVIIVVCVFLSTVLLSVVFIEVLVKRNLTNTYEIFRLMHEHYIPEWVIAKEKIIKVKLIREGFMKE